MAEISDIPGTLLKPEAINPLFKYGIHRDLLLSQNVSMQDIDRIYRALFVYSIGFQEIIKKCVN